MSFLGFFWYTDFDLTNSITSKQNFGVGVKRRGGEN